MEVVESTRRQSRSRSLAVQPGAEGLGSTSELLPSDGNPRSALAAATAAATAATTAKTAAFSTKTPECRSEPSFLRPPGEPCTRASFTHKIGWRRPGFEPVCVSRFSQDPCTTNDLSSSPVPVPGSSAGPSHGSGPGCDSGQGPGAQGQQKTPQVEEKCKVLNETLPRGHCLLFNWEEERATNHLDQVPSMQDGSESFFFRHGHQGLLTMQLPSPMSFSTTQKDSYQPPRNYYPPIRGKREAMLEMLLHHQICKEVLAEQEPTGRHPEVESVTHHDYRKELVQARPPAPTKPHDYRWEQPETFWIQRAPQLPVCEGVGSGGEEGGEEAAVFWLGTEQDLSSSWPSSRVSATSRPWTRHSGRTAASRHQYPYRWGSLCPMNLRIIPTNWEKYLPLPVREEDKVVKWVELLSKA
ncbi:sperm-associated antigen 8 isoform X3 [Vulpes lagopus]|uniref:sperm-associated antigen 8 isoform X3 n=1 Tax=Vulpes lagopus TaxID=494514 RepID=UPI001BC92A6C|nr:sperm-associated antigen 8 isoform X3 [Vulpes lagopus]